MASSAIRSTPTLLVDSYADAYMRLFVRFCPTTLILRYIYIITTGVNLAQVAKYMTYPKVLTDGTLRRIVAVMMVGTVASCVCAAVSDNKIKA